MNGGLCTLQAGADVAEGGLFNLKLTAGTYVWVHAIVGIRRSQYEWELPTTPRHVGASPGLCSAINYDIHGLLGNPGSPLFYLLLCQPMMKIAIKPHPCL